MKYDNLYDNAVALRPWPDAQLLTQAIRPELKNLEYFGEN